MDECWLFLIEMVCHGPFNQAMVGHAVSTTDSQVFDLCREGDDEVE